MKRPSNLRKERLSLPWTVQAVRHNRLKEQEERYDCAADDGDNGCSCDNHEGFACLVTLTRLLMSKARLNQILAAFKDFIDPIPQVVSPLEAFNDEAACFLAAL